jgi:membrane-associated phospholipid phosphatase
MRSITLALLEAGSSKGSAFPSSHVAVSVTQTILAWHYFGARRGAVVAMVAAGLAAGAVYGGFHYAVDVIAGAVLGAGIAAAGLRMIARMKSAATSGERERADVSGVAAVVRE